MKFRDMHNNDPADNTESDLPDNDHSSQQMRERRDESDAFYSAAEQVIHRVLSDNSDTFLNSMEQTVGQ